MANSKLLKEAIADAKAVKETALANAKLALEEAFTPRLQSILSQKMRAEAEEMENDDDKSMDEELDSTGIGSKVGTDAAETPGSQPSLYANTDLSVGVAKDGGKPEQSGTDYTKVADINEEDDYDFDGEEEDDNAEEIAELRARLAELEDGGDDWADGFSPENEEEDPFASMKGDDNSYGMEDEEDDHMEPDMDNMGGESDNDEDNMDLESIIRELEAQLGDDESDGEDDEEMPAEDPNADKIAELKRQLAELEDGGEDWSDSNEPKTESKKLRESRRRLREDYTDGAAAGTDEDGEKVIDLEEILREMEDDMKGGSEEDDSEELKSDLEEAYKTIKSLQSTINEVNLLNAKLLFANKLFRAHNMTNEQKIKVIETLDRTKSVREVKLVYSTLAENFKYTSSNKIAKKSIAEGIASKVTKSTKPATAQKQVISESVAISNRFKKLAGIIK
jgi:hypothetical protein